MFLQAASATAGKTVLLFWKKSHLPFSRTSYVPFREMHPEICLFFRNILVSDLFSFQQFTPRVLIFRKFKILSEKVDFLDFSNIQRYTEIYRDIQSAKVVEIHSVFSLWRQIGGISPILIKTQ